MTFFLCLFNVLLFCSEIVFSAAKFEEYATNEHNPYNQVFPDCSKSNPLVTKSKLKVLACPMIKDEMGFLSEYAAYYKVQGFSHITFFNDFSTDNFMDELEPWIKTGFVSVKHNVTIPKLRGTEMKTPFLRAMAEKAAKETICMEEAIEWGYDYFVSIDLDEYIVPTNLKVSFVDQIQEWQDTSNAKMFCMMKANFASTPHIQEPVHLLQIEAYQTRMKTLGRMNHYTSVAKKCIYKLRDESYAAFMPHFISHCCHFHGCNARDLTTDSNICNPMWKNATKLLFQGKYYPLGRINHYSRSLEKYGLKASSWKTATGESATGYSLSYFLHRSTGYSSDTSALNYACETRRILKEVTGAQRFLRAGEMWYRNIEFGKRVSDPSKRGRYGAEKKDRVMDGNPFLFDGTKLPTP